MISVVPVKLLGAIFVVLQLDLLLSNCYYGAAAAKQVGCIEKERHALLDLKADLVVEDTYLLSSWDSNSDCCEWKGVICSNQTGHVEMLDLNGNQFGPFQGKISASLIELPYLKHLDLSWNMFRSNSIPEFIGSLSNLRFLDLGYSKLGGRIPNDVASLSHLQYLDLSVNMLEGTIPHQLENLSHLQHLDLSWNKLDGTIPHQLGNLSHLQRLHLDSNRLNGKIPHQLGNLSHLQYLEIGWNHLAGTIPHQLGSLSNLQELQLGHNEGLKVVDDKNHAGGEWLSNLTLLTHLDLSGVHNNLNYSHGWLQMIGMLPKIEELKLSDCDLSDPYLLSLSRSTSNFSTSLKFLDLSGNDFSSSIIFQWVFDATSNLTELDLSFNQLEGSIPYGTNICTLRSLHLDHNKLNENISTTLFNLFGCARYSLQELSLRHNQITGTLPDFSIFPSLKEIDLSNNLLSGELPDSERLPSTLESLKIESNSLEGGIPKSFGNLCSLRTLNLFNNTLSKELSMIIHDLSVGCAKYSLQKLILDGNQITGTVPDMSVFSSLETLILSDNLLNEKILKNSRFPYQLKNLYLNFNKLGGVISDSHFGNMSMLKSIDLSYNSLTLKFSDNWVPPFQLFDIYLGSCILGPNFPKWLQSQKNLRVLDISDVGISDVVPVWFWAQSAKLKIMNISYNNLTGTIPNLPIRLPKGCQVILDSNQFEGSIPPFFRSAALLQLSKNKFSEIQLLLCTNTMVDRLVVLDLSNNQLSRRLLDCWSHFKALVFLDLSDNTLSGEVPSSMGSLHKLRVLILRNNSLTGKLPISLKNCTELVMLDLGDNRLSGRIPDWLGQQLQMLSLRRNRFSGRLPQNLCYLTNIQLLDLSENILSGRIFRCLKNFSAMSQNVSSTTASTHYFYRIGYGDYRSYEGYDLIALLMWKGAERLFKNNELILRSIDLSSNQLTGVIPEEIGSLVELVSLNLSSNKLTGEITSEIGRLTSLEFLDLSRNHFFGSIPPSLAQIDRLSMLNLSNNNLSGRIPIGTQLQSFDASSYEGNADLCGKPLDKKCPGDEEAAPQEPETPEESSPEDKKSIYLSVSLGFITGCWGLWGSLLLNRTWRHAYMLFLNNIIDTVYVFTVMNAAKFQRWLRSLLEKFV